MPALQTAEHGRRFLLTVGVSRYGRSTALDLPEVRADLPRVIGLFESRLGYRHVPVVPLDPTTEDVRRGLRAFAKDPDRKEDDHVVVYLAGHGEVPEPRDEHFLLTTESDPDDIAHTALSARLLGSTLLERTNIRRLLLILDLCVAGTAGHEVMDAAERTAWTRDIAGSERPGLVVVMSSRSRGDAAPGFFAAALARAIETPLLSGHVPEVLPIDALVEAIRRDESRPKWQEVHWSSAGASGLLPDFLPNPHYEPRAEGLPVADADRVIAVRSRERELREEGMRTHFLSRARGAGNPSETAWRFTGRHHALADVKSWLDAADGTRACVVTGDPGSGKSAVLGLVAAYADPERRPGIPDLGLPETSIVAENRVQAAIQASYLTTDQILTAIAAVVDAPRPSVGGVIRAIQERTEPITILIDSLDEARNPRETVTDLLLPLLDTKFAVPLRLLLGTRTHVLPWLRTNSTVVNLDDSTRYADPRAVAAYTRRLLLDGAPDSPYRTIDPTRLDSVASAIAEAAGHSFLVARITARTHAELAEPADPHDAAWRDGLPRVPGEAMRQDLAKRLGTDAARARDLLLPLAFAEGAGLPWVDIWAPLASAVSGRPYTEEDLLWLRQRAGAYFLEGTAHRRPVYRLYHRALIEHMKADCDEVAVQRRITDFLIGYTRDRAARPGEWHHAHPYVRSHLAAHAAASGGLDDLLQDAGYVLHADPASVLGTLPWARTEPGRAAARACRGLDRRVNRDTDPGTAAAHLMLAARRAGAGSLAASVERLPLTLPWRVRWAAGEDRPRGLGLFAHLRDVHRLAVHRANSGDCAIILRGNRLQQWSVPSGAEMGVTQSLTELKIDRNIRDFDVAEIDGTPHLVAIDFAGTVHCVNLTGFNRIGRWTEHLPFHDPYPGPPRVGDTPSRGAEVARVRLLDGGSASTVALLGDAGKFALRTLDGGVVPLPTDGSAVNIACCTGAVVNGQPIVVTGDNDGTVRWWHPGSASTNVLPVRHPPGVTVLRIVDFGMSTILVSGGRDGHVRICDLGTADTPVRAVRVCSEAVQALDVQRIGNQWLLAVACGRSGLLRFDLATGQPLGDPCGSGTISSVHVIDSPDGLSALVIDNGGVGSWDMISGDMLAGAQGPAFDEVHALTVTSGSTPTLITGHTSGLVRMWDPQTGDDRGALPDRHASKVTALAAMDTAGRRLVLSGGEDGDLRVFALGDRAEPVTVLTFPTPILAIVPVRIGDGELCVTSTLDGGVHIIDPLTGRVHRTLGSTAGPVTTLAVTLDPERPFVVGGTAGGDLLLWDPADGEQVRRVAGAHGDWIRHIAVTGYDEGRPLLTTVSDDGTTRCWDPATGAPSGPAERTHRGWMYAVADPGDPTTHAAGELFGATTRGALGSWRIVDGTPKPVTRERTPHVFSAVGRGPEPGSLITGDRMGVLRLHDLSGRRDTRVLHRPTGTMTAVTIGRIGDADVVLAGDTFGRMHTFDLASGTRLRRPFGNDEWPVSELVGCRVDDEWIVLSSGSASHSPRVWHPEADPADESPGELLGGNTSGTAHYGLRALAVPPTTAEEIAYPVAVTLTSVEFETAARIWDLRTWESRGLPFAGPTRPTRLSVCARAGGAVAAMGLPGSVQLVDLTAVDRRAYVRLVEAGSLDALLVHAHGVDVRLVTGHASGVLSGWQPSWRPVSRFRRRRRKADEPLWTTTLRSATGDILKILRLDALDPGYAVLTRNGLHLLGDSGRLRTTVEIAETCTDVAAARDGRLVVATDGGLVAFEFPRL